MYEKWLNVLSMTPIFKDIPEENLMEMLGCLRPKLSNYKKNEYIAVYGEKFEGIGVFLSGNAEVIKESVSGSRVIMAMLKPGDLFGEIAAFSRNKAWPASVFAQDDCTVIFLPPQKIVGECEKMCTGHRMLIVNMLGIVSEKALMLNRKVEYLAIKSMRGKISTFLIEQYKRSGSTTYMMPLNRNELADFLNVSRPSMSREMCRMRDEGIIDFHRSSIRIINIEELMRSAE